MISKYFNMVFKPQYYVKRLLLIILCNIHEYTKYHTARSFKDLFYWPEGLCIDMLVIACFFLIALLAVRDDFKFLIEYMKNTEASRY